MALCIYFKTLFLSEQFGHTDNFLSIFLIINQNYLIYLMLTDFTKKYYCHISTITFRINKPKLTYVGLENSHKILGFNNNQHNKAQIILCTYFI